MKYLFLFTLGPVQSFIAQARKTQDLYAGSKILSDLIKVAIKKIGQDNVIFPYVKDKNLQTEIDSLPNRFIAEINKPESELAQLGREVENAVKDKFKEIAEDIFTKTLKLDKEITHKKLWEKFEKQISQHLDIHWLFLKQTGDYAKDFAEIEQLLGAIKNVRTFEQNEETGRKCSIDGERNALFFKHNYSKDEQGKETKRKPNYLDNDAKPVPKDDFRLEQGEGLSAVSMVKRLYEKEEFPATAEVALMSDEVKAIEDEEVKKCLNSYKKIFQDEKDFILECLKIKENVKFTDKKDFRKPFDYQLLFEESVNEKNIPNAEQLACAKKLFPNLKSHFKTKYYALIAFDADGMGSKLGSAKSKEEHQKISELLGNFATKAQEYIDNNNFGRTVYAGGDDFLGFLNLNHLFEAMQELRQIFDQEINKELDKLGYSHLKLTFSAGVAIAHYKNPLSEVLTWARAMEKEAKKIDKTTTPATKNAFGIAVLKHSGEIHKTLWKWTYSIHDSSRGLEEELWMTDLAKTLTDYLKDKKLSDKFISNLSIEFENLMNPQGELPKSHDPILDIELRRLAERARNKQQLSEKDLKELMTKFYQVYSQFRDFQGLQNLLNLFHICEFVGRHLNKKQPISQQSTIIPQRPTI